MEQLFRVLGIGCIVIVVLLSLYMHWFVNKKAGQQMDNIEKVVVKGAVIRTVLVILAALFLIATQAV